MAKSVAAITCGKCKSKYRTKLKRGVPVRGCPHCGSPNGSKAQKDVRAS